MRITGHRQRGGILTPSVGRWGRGQRGGVVLQRLHVADALRAATTKTFVFAGILGVLSVSVVLRVPRVVMRGHRQRAVGLPRADQGL
jgi:hypothetical protein